MVHQVDERISCDVLRPPRVDGAHVRRSEVRQHGERIVDFGNPWPQSFYQLIVASRATFGGENYRENT